MAYYKPLPPSLTPKAIANWIDDAQHGDTLDYHYGYLPADSDYRKPYGAKISDLAAVAWQAHLSGLVSLVQRKSAEHLYTYKMQRILPQ
jgi:hypothetical protein